MAFFDRTEQEIVSSSIDALSQNTNITQLTPGGKTRFLLDTIAREQASQHQVFDTNLLNAFIRYADSKFLDFLGDMLNLPRNEARHAFDDTDNFMFYVVSGTFGDINSGNPFTVPAGTIVSTVPYDATPITPGIESQPIIQFKTTATVTGAVNASYVYAPIKAIIEGSSSDVPRNVLNQHDFGSYTLFSQGNLKCTNRYSVSTGENRETDESYRYRLTNVFRAREMAVLASIRLAALSVPGVSDVTEVLCEQGPGTFSLYVQGLTPTTSPKLIQEVAASVNLLSAYGVRPFILPPNPIGLEFVAAIKWSPRATTEQINSGYANMRNSLETYMNSIRMGESIALSDLIDVLLRAAPMVNSIGVNKSNSFESVYAHRTNPSSSGGTIRSLIIGDVIVPLYNERVVLETSNRFRGIQFIIG
jgi:hypothetical protein